ncbi:MAG TPA: hypothetical protein PLV68_03375, partial [Ilumatobacteraceae bacterium]|nr:hypothetical protein [Ilumatobacteraceae bacterium]
DTRRGPKPADRSQTVITGLPNRSAVVSLVATETTGPGYVQVLPCGDAPGAASNINADHAGQTVSGLAVIRFGADGQACIFTQTATHLVVDLQSYLADAAFDDIPDQRLVDTRNR